MANIRSVNDLILSLIDFYKLVQPNLDTKVGTVARDLFIDGLANPLALLYDELSLISQQQSYRLVSGTDLDRLALNFGLTRKQGLNSTGAVLLTFSSIVAPVSVNVGDLMTASNGFSYSSLTNASIISSNINYYRSVATKYKKDLDFLGITDQYALEISAQATSVGSSGNLGKYSLVSTSIPGVSNVTNIAPFVGGTDQETDSVFRDRILAVFRGASIGTALGYQNTALATTGVNDALVIEPGDPLMTRDGTVSTINSDGSYTITTEGTGGKVDVIILGNSLQENLDSFIYRDKGNNNDPTNSKNDYVLGQISGDESKTITRKRVDNIKNSTLPQQPAEEILEVSGSLSGTNFIPKSIDQYGRVTGNYELIKDTGIYAGSPWGFDKIHWVSDRISDFSEDKVKGQFNGQDPTTFTNVTEISTIEQNVQISNENSTVTSDRSVIQLLHFPATNVTRVFNTNTGERYIVTSQNPDNTGTTNTSGRIKISGNTLPSPTDILQVDYVWVVSYDQYSDYDGKVNTSNVREVDDNIDWGYANLVRKENIKFALDPSAGFFTGTTLHPISAINQVNEYYVMDGYVYQVTSGVYTNRLAVYLQHLENITESISSIKLKHTNTEVYNTDDGSGTFSNETVVVGLNLRYNTTIILPNDTLAASGDRVETFLNSTNIFTGTDVGSFNNNTITIPQTNVDAYAPNQIWLDVSYIANVSELQNAAVATLPFSRSGNGYLNNNNLGFTNNFATNLYKKDILSVQQNLSLQYYIEISLTDLDYDINVNDVVSIVRIFDGKELWNRNHQGTVAVNSTTNAYQFILSGYNTPAIDNRVLVVYYANDIRRFQPFTYKNELIKARVDILAQDLATGNFYAQFDDLTIDSTLTCQFLDPVTEEVLGTFADGYIDSVSNVSGVLGSTGFSFVNISNILSKKIKITNSIYEDNNDTFDIIQYNESTNTVTFSNSVAKLSTKQVSIIRLSDGKELWNSSGTVNYAQNKLILSSSAQTNLGDFVLVVMYDYYGLRQTPCKLSVNLSDQVSNKGSVTLSGNTLTKIADIVFTASSTGLKQNLIDATRRGLKLSSNTAIPSNVQVARIAKLEKVTTISANSDEVYEVLYSYDLNNIKIKDNYLYSNDHISDPTLSTLEFVLPSTSGNTSNIAEAKNLPQIGDRLRVTFYIVTSNDMEVLNYTRNGLLFTNKVYTSIDKAYVSSGLNSSLTSKVILNSFTQPTQGAKYKAYYDYMAPKVNERIVIRYNYNKLISDVTFNIEETRPINADVLAKQATELPLDVTMYIVVTDEQLDSSAIVVQNVKDNLIDALTSVILGGIIDSSDLINTAYTVEGVDRARITYFNKNGEEGQALSVVAQKNQYFIPNNIIVNVETR